MGESLVLDAARPKPSCILTTEGRSSSYRVLGTERSGYRSSRIRKYQMQPWTSETVVSTSASLGRQPCAASSSFLELPRAITACARLQSYLSPGWGTCLGGTALALRVIGHWPHTLHRSPGDRKTSGGRRVARLNRPVLAPVS